MARTKGSKNVPKALPRGPVAVDMQRKGGNKEHGWLPCLYPYTMFDPCDYCVGEILPGDGTWNGVVMYKFRRVSTEHALQNHGLTFRSDQDLLLQFVKKYPERKNDLIDYLPDNTLTTRTRVSLPAEPPKFDLSKFTKRELTEILRDDPRCDVDFPYARAVRRELDKRLEEESG